MEPNRWMIELADLVLGADCPGCGVPAVTWCRRCGLAARPRPRLVDLGPGLPPCTAALTNDLVVGRLLVAWKEHGRFGLLQAWSLALAAACVPHLQESPVALVAVPTARANIRARGGDPVLDLARATARRLRGDGVDVTAVAALRRSRRTRDQAGLDASARRANVAGAFAVGRPAGLNGRQILVVDDIVTTGASAIEAVRALAAGGWPVNGMCVVAHTVQIASDHTST